MLRISEKWEGVSVSAGGLGVVLFLAVLVEGRWHVRAGKKFRAVEVER